MNNIFKKLFDIPYQGKTFTIFVDQNHRCTFLEKENSGNYTYPTVEDYKALNQIYNVHDWNSLPTTKTYTFSEKVRIGAFLVTTSIVTFASAYASSTQSNKAIIEEVEKPNETLSNWEVEIKENEVVCKENLPSYEEVPISTLEELNKVLPERTITLLDIDKAMEYNVKLDANIKALAHELAAAILEEEPNADLRIFYTNLYTLESEEMSEEDYRETFQDYSGGTYSPKTNKISYIKGCEKQTLVHELSHATYSINLYKNNKIYYHDFRRYHALNEIMNNKIVDFVMPSTSYSNITSITDYLFTFVEFDFNRYIHEGPSYILKDIKEMYPNIDVSYINDVLNTMKDSSIKLDIRIKLENCPSLEAELFQLCQEKVKKNPEEGYKPLLDFLEMFPNNEEKFFYYLEEYNTHLDAINFNHICEKDLFAITLPYERVRSFVWNGENLYPCLQYDNDSITVVENGEEIQYPADSFVQFQVDYFSLKLKKYLLDKGNVEFQTDFWKNFAIENNYISADFLCKTNILYKGETLIQDYGKNLSVQIGLTPNNQIGFILKKGDALLKSPETTVIYQTADNLKNLSKSITLNYYYPKLLEDIEKVELTDIFNTSYLKEIQSDKNLFSNLYIKENELILEPAYLFYVEDGESIKFFNLNQGIICQGEEESIFSNCITFNVEIPFEEPLYLKDVLEYLNILDKNNPYYSFSKEELKDLVKEYVEERKQNQSR